MGFIKNRQLWDKTRRMSNIIDYVNGIRIPVLVYFSDPEKVFDRIQVGFPERGSTENGLWAIF